MIHELTLRAPEALVEAVSDLLVDEAGALSVSVEDADADSAAEQALYGEPGMPAPAAGWQRSTVKALFDTEAAADRAAAAVLARYGDPVEGDRGNVGNSDSNSDSDSNGNGNSNSNSNSNSHQGGRRGDCVQFHALQPLADQDWVRLTQSQFTPVSITDDFWIVPSWHEVPAAARQVLRLDPGLAFGTGTHPTTRMCLRWLAAQPPSDRAGRVLDYGCGSGILAIGAALLGFGRGAQGAVGNGDDGAAIDGAVVARASMDAASVDIDAVDIDPAAVQASLDNAERNGVRLHAGTPELARGRYALVLANILATPLKLLAPLLAAHVAPGGHLVLAGILDRQAAELQAAYAPWLELIIGDREDGWILMTARAPAA